MPPEALGHESSAGAPSLRRVARYHRRTRGPGARRWVYWPARAVIDPLCRTWLRARAVGMEHVPREGALILASNHRSFLDPFLLCKARRRPLYFVAKREAFRHRLYGWLLNSVGAFPVARGERDEEALATARAVLARGEVLAIFPEGTRVRSGPLGRPRPGIGALAMETGAPVVPVALVNSEHVRRGWRIRRVRVTGLAGPALRFGPGEDPRAVTASIWKRVAAQYELLADMPDPTPGAVRARLRAGELDEGASYS